MGDLLTGDFGNEREPRQVLIDALEECDSYAQLVIVVRDKEHDVRMGWSTGRYLDHIGMLQFAVTRFCNDLGNNVE